jgi:hypothetical protein
MTRGINVTICGVIPFLDLFRSFFFCDAVPFLDLSQQLLVLPGDHVEVIIRQFAPLFFDRALYLLPLAFKLI